VPPAARKNRVERSHPGAPRVTTSLARQSRAAVTGRRCCAHRDDGHGPLARGAASGSDEISWDNAMRSVLNTLPVVILIGGLAVLTFELLPRLTVAIPATRCDPGDSDGCRLPVDAARSRALLARMGALSTSGPGMPRPLRWGAASIMLGKTRGREQSA
jgi:hypothetical protein